MQSLVQTLIVRPHFNVNKGRPLSERIFQEKLTDLTCFFILHFYVADGNCDFIKHTSLTRALFLEVLHNTTFPKLNNRVNKTRVTGTDNYTDLFI